MSKYLIILFSAFSLTLFSCGGDSNQDGSAPAEGKSNDITENKTEDKDPAKSIGVGPIKEVKLGEIDPAMAKEGEDIFQKNCSSCHKIDKRFVGPAISGVTERRTPEWIMNMIMNPEEMVKKDPTAKALLAEYLAPMANQNISEDQARKILEYFRHEDNK